MNTQIVIKEYGWIIPQEKEAYYLKSRDEARDYACLPQKQLDFLISYIQKTPSILDFMEYKFQKGIGKYIYIKKYVGEIVFQNGIKIQVLPKVYFDGSQDRTREILMQMLIGSRKLSEKYFQNTEASAGNVELLEGYIRMYLSETSLLVKRGLRSSYEEKTDNLTCFKGRLQVPGHIRKNLTNRTRFYVSYEEFTLNRPENRLIKATLQRLLKISSSTANRKEAKRLLSFFDKVEASVNYRQDFARIHVDRNSREYARIMPWTETILNNQGMLQFTQGFEATSILFAMEEVFENYVACQAEKYLQDTWDVSAQDTGTTLFDIPDSSQRSGKLYFHLRPDIVLRHRTQNRTIILDTKWKIVPENCYKYPAEVRDDMYQMYVYAGRFQASDIFLLYPKSEYSDQYVDAYDTLHTSAFGQKFTIHLFFIDLTDMEKSMQQLQQKLDRICAGNHLE